ncbi:MAG: EthD family reductase [Acidobacteriota bacterium]|jgi:uncharacterized protein (TIGR02118 family)
MIRISVMYPKPGKFDFDYYVNKHIPMVHKLLDSYGLVESEIDKGVGEGPYVAVGHLVFDKIEDMQSALEHHDPDLAKDLPNFTDIQPIFQVSEILVK